MTGVSKYLKSWSLGLKAGLEYRANFFFSIAAAAAPVVIQTALWIALYGGARQEELFGFTFPQMVAYTVIAQLVSRLVRTGFEYEVNNDIRSGSLDRFLVKPVSYFGFRLFSFLGDKAVHLAVTSALLTVSLALLSALVGVSVSLQGTLLFVLAILVSFLVNFLVFWSVSLAGFWLTEIGFLFEAVRIVIIAASGGIFPLSVFGPAGQRILNSLPFRFTIQWPAEILLGRVAGTSLAADFLQAALWALVLFVISSLVWRRGIRRFAAVGS